MADLYERLRRIAARNAPPDGLNAVASIDPDALFQYEALADKPVLRRGALYRESVLLKDNIATAGRLPTTAGSLALKRRYARADAFVTRKIREADGVILGKTNMTEFANFLADDMPAGYSSLGGQVKNAHNPDDTPSGSSSGSAVAVAAGFCDMAVGTETGGSVISPAQNAGIVGVKPTIGLVSRDGIVPISPTLDTAGPMTCTVADAARLLSVMAGSDENDPATHVLRYRETPDLSIRARGNGLRGWRVALNRGSKTSKDYAPFEDMLTRLLRDAGAECADCLPLAPVRELGRIMHYEFRAALDNHFSAEGVSARSIYDYNAAHADEALRYGQARLERALRESTGRMTDPEYLLALCARREAQDTLHNAMDGADVMLFTAGYTNWAPFTGYPAATIPIGRYYNNVPAGCYFVARPFEDGVLLSFLSALEAEINARGMFTL